MEIVEFIDVNTERYIGWLQSKFDICFPYCCTYASQTLGAYLKCYYTDSDVEIILGNYTEIEEDWLHSWLYVDGICVDMTVGQFVCGETVNNVTDYYEVINEDSLTFMTDNMEEEYPYYYYTPIQVIEPKEILTQLAVQSINFEDYLEKVGHLVKSTSDIREIYF